MRENSKSLWLTISFLVIHEKDKQLIEDFIIICVEYIIAMKWVLEKKSRNRVFELTVDIALLCNIFFPHRIVV